MRLFLRHSGERVIRRSLSPSPMLTVSLTGYGIRPEHSTTFPLLRHFTDLRDGTHGGAISRQDKERLFTAAVALLDPHARQPLKEINTDLLLGTGEVTATGVRRRDGLDAI
jgi:hypothetical protein